MCGVKVSFAKILKQAKTINEMIVHLKKIEQSIPRSSERTQQDIDYENFQKIKWVSVDDVLPILEAEEAKQEPLRKEIAHALTNGWEKRDYHEWDIYLEEEIAPYYPTLFEFLRNVTVNEVFGADFSQKGALGLVEKKEGEKR
jgi:hypothetical protein